MTSPSHHCVRYSRWLRRPLLLTRERCNRSVVLLLPNDWQVEQPTRQSYACLSTTTSAVPSRPLRVRSTAKQQPKYKYNNNHRKHPTTVSSTAQEDTIPNEQESTWKDSPWRGGDDDEVTLTNRSMTMATKSSKPTSDPVDRELWDRQFLKLDQIHQEFLRAMAEYLAFLPPQISREPPPQDWKQAIRFRHPARGKPLSSTNSSRALIWQKIQNSEEDFQSICRHCHDFLSITADIISPDGVPASHRHLLTRSQALWYDQAFDILTQVLPFWDTMRKERALWVNHYRPRSRLSKQEKTPHATTSDEGSQEDKTGHWLWGLLPSFLVGGKNKQSTVAATTVGTGASTSPPPVPPIKQVIAHQDAAFGPTQQFYAEVVGRLYFASSVTPSTNGSSLHTNDGETADVQVPLMQRQQRAQRIQTLVDSFPKHLVQGKLLKLLLRAWEDVGTLESAHNVEQVWMRYANINPLNLRLRFHVIMAYLRVTEQSQPPFSLSSSSTSPQDAILAARRVCAILEDRAKDQRLRGKWLSTGLQCLANITPPQQIPHYYEWISRFARFQFGSQKWQRMIDVDKANNDQVDFNNRDQATDNEHDPLGGAGERRPYHDMRSLHCCIVAYAKDPSQQQIAQRLMDQLLTLQSSGLRAVNYPSRDTFHAVLQGLALQARSKGKATTLQSILDQESEPVETPPDEEMSQALTYGMQLMDEMINRRLWPTEQTFTLLLSLCQTGPEADLILQKMEVARILSPQNNMSLLTATKYALNAWAKTAKYPDDDTTDSAAERALRLLERLQIQSTPLLLKDPAYHKSLAHVYQFHLTPDRDVYTLVLKTCAMTTNPSHHARALEVAMKVHSHLVTSQQVLVSTTMYMWLLEAIADLAVHDRDRQKQLAAAIFEEAKTNNRVTSLVLQSLQRAHPHLYNDYTSQQVQNGETQQEEPLNKD